LGKFWQKTIVRHQLRLLPRFAKCFLIRYFHSQDFQEMAQRQEILEFTGMIADNTPTSNMVVPCRLLTNLRRTDIWSAQKPQNKIP
jgi:hypothetical protein